jgi:hypothetical protein
MNAEHTGHTCGDRAPYRRDGARDDVEVGADQRRQEGSRAEAAMRRADGADRRGS